MQEPWLVTPNRVAPLHTLDGAVRAQGYRPVANATLEEGRAVDLARGLPDDMARVLMGVVSDPGWQTISNQLALLRTRSHTFDRLYVGVRKNLFLVTVVNVYPGWRERALPAGAPLSLDRWRADYDWTWDVLRFLEPHIGRYRMAGDWAPAARAAIDKYGDASGPGVAAGLSLLASALELAEASRGPCGTFIGVTFEGCDPDLAQALSKGKFAATKSVFQTIPGLSAFAWDPTTKALHGAGMPDALERKSLERSLNRFR